MDLQKIYTDADFSNAEIPEGQILTYLGTDESGNVVTRYKDSQGNVGTIAGSGGSNQPTVDVVTGYFINTDGEITFKALDGTTENVQEISIVDTGVEEPDYNKCSTGGMDFYKCASVDTANKTWTGYKAVLTDGVYAFEENVTENLIYDKIIPEVDRIYTDGCKILVGYVYTGVFPEYSTPINPTGNVYQDWIIDASSEYDSSRQAYNAFTELVSDSGSWHTSGETNPWIRWKNINEPVLIKWYYVHFHHETIADGFILQGSLDGEVWETIDTVDNSSLEDKVTRELDNSQAYNQHRIVFGDCSYGYIAIYNITAKSFY